MSRLTPEREAEIRKAWEGTRAEADELLSEIDALRLYIQKLKQENLELIMDCDVLNSVLELHKIKR